MKDKQSGGTLARIAEMEAALNAAAKLNADLEAQLDALDAGRADLKKLFDYYGSEAWYDDREAELPGDVRAGVLGEDLVYDELVRLRGLSFRMLELATDILKNVL